MRERDAPEDDQEEEPESLDPESSRSSAEEAGDRPRKKVSFADSHGLVLVYVASAGDLSREASSCEIASLSIPVLRCPFAVSIDKARRQGIALSFVDCEGGDSRRLAGLVYVANRAYEKSVSVRWSTDGWRSVKETPAVYSHAVDGGVDAFRFYLCIPSGIHELSFCLRCTSAGTDAWDNNGGRDYRIQW